MSEIQKCSICGEPMPEGEEMFMYHGYSGPCPKQPPYNKENHNEILIDENIHVAPTSGKKHFENKHCWCHPHLVYKDEITSKEVWVHKGYEELEQ